LAYLSYSLSHWERDGVRALFQVKKVLNGVKHLEICYILPNRVGTKGIRAENRKFEKKEMLAIDSTSIKIHRDGTGYLKKQ